jgi:hypothetical protein
MLSALLKYASSRTPSQGRVAVHAYQEGEEPVISISYEGGEMTRPELRRLFSSGAGEESPAGLAHVRRLAEQHECRVWLESQRGAETSLFLALPRWSSTRTETVAPLFIIKGRSPVRTLVRTALSLGVVSMALLHPSPGLSQQSTIVQIAVDVSLSVQGHGHCSRWYAAPGAWPWGGGIRGDHWG